VSTGRIDVTLCTLLSQGGIAHYTYCLASALQAAGITVTQLVGSYPEYELQSYPHAHRVLEDLRLGVTPWSRLTSPVRNLQTMLQATRHSQIVHLQWSLGARTDRALLPLLRRLGKSLVYTAHDVLPHESSIMSERHARWLYRYPDALFVHGESLKTLLVGRFDVDPALVHVVPHGNFNFISDTPGPWSRMSARKSFGFEPSDRVVLFFGLIRDYKGLDTLIQACRLVSERGLPRGQRLKVIIAGRVFSNHWDEGRYDAAIRDSGIGDHIQLHLRHVEMAEIARFFRAADVLAVPYKRGSQSGVLRLAYSFALATVATNVGSLSEVSGRDVSRFVAPDDPAAFADELWDLLADTDRAQSLGRRGRKYADEVLGWDRIAQTTRAVYEVLLADHT
jgi:glycosyltransferase involved in cell wall biosynthesis